jgi:uroporphyrinogen decarboxylase
MTPRERVDRVLAGKEADRLPFTFWYHFGLEKLPGDRHAQATLDFHRRLRTDLVKVMSDYPYPKETGFVANPFPEQIRALEMIRDGLGGKAHFVETVFNPWNQTVKTWSKDEVSRLMSERPQQLLDRLENVAKSEASHAKRAIAAGASGIFLAIDNAIDGVLTREQYKKFSEPFDRMVLDAVRSAPLNILHLHGDKVYLDLFWKGWPAAAVNYSSVATGVPIAEARKKYSGVLLGGLDEVNFRKLTPEQLLQQWKQSHQAAGAKHILTPGCSVPNDTTDKELLRVTRMLGA